MFLFIFFIIIDLYFLVLAVIAQNLNPISAIAIPIGIPIKEVKTKIEIHSVIVETKIRNYSV